MLNAKDESKQAEPYTKFDVQQVMHDVAALRAKRQAAHQAALEQSALDKVTVPENDVALAAMDDIPLEWEVSQFGLAADVRDPVSEKIFVMARPEKEGQARVLLTAEKVDELVVDAHKTVLAARMKAAEKALAEAKAKADKAKADREAAAKAAGSTRDVQTGENRATGA